MSRLLAGLLVLLLLVPSMTGCGGQAESEYAVHVYTRSDACGAAETWARYLGDYHQEDLEGTAVYGDPGLAEAVRRDNLGIGYNNLNYAYDMGTGEQIAGLRIVPIDLNENGRIDADEDFYAAKPDLVQAIATGRYPSPPARELNLVSKGKFTGTTREFVSWILTDGQAYVDEVGYIALSEERAEQELGKLEDGQPGTQIEGEVTVSGAWALYPMMVRWAEEFERVHPGVKFHISAGGAGKGMSDALGGMVDIGMVSREIYPAEVDKGAFWVSVTKDAVVPVVSDENPVLDDLVARGVTREIFINIWIAGEVTDWRDTVK
jgi:ABC-type phosphate transport system substrate-binding protein